MNFFKDHLNLSNNIYDNAQILKAAEIKKQQEVVDRNPTTKYYQTLALNLQEQVQYLKKLLNEATPDGGLQMTDQEDYERGQIGRMQNNPPEPHPNQGRDPNIPRPFNPADGVFPTFICPVPNCTPGSSTWLTQFRYWVLAQDGRWHGWNDYPALSDQWWAWEIDKQLNPPKRKDTPPGTPGTFNHGPPSPDNPSFPMTR